MKLPYLREALNAFFQKPSTVTELPEACEGYRGRLVYHADRCINCGLCMRVCSPGAITKQVEKIEEGDRITFTIDLSSCTFCSMCANFCSKNAIELSRDYNMVGTQKEDFLVSGTFVKKTIVRPNIPPKAPAAPKAEAPKSADDAKFEEPSCPNPTDAPEAK